MHSQIASVPAKSLCQLRQPRNNKQPEPSGCQQHLINIYWPHNKYNSNRYRSFQNVDDNEDKKWRYF